MIKKLFNKLFNINPNAISFKQGYDLTNLTVCTFYQGEEKLNLLLDSGSTHCIIDKNILDKIKHEFTNSQSSLYGLEGKKNIVPICKIPISYKEQVYEFEYLVKDMEVPFEQIKAETGVTLHGILGTNFFNKFKYVIDFDELIAYSKA